MNGACARGLVAARALRWRAGSGGARGWRDETAGPAIVNMSTREDGDGEMKDDGAGSWDKS
jgi:hypothetical protein